MERVWILCKKTFSLTLVFNALLTIACSVGILAGFYGYYADWKPFSPYLFSGNVFWVAIIAAAINVFPSALIGRKLHTGRFLFHHYFYGFLVLAFAAVYIVIFIPVPLSTIFLVNNTNVAVNAGRFLLLGGFTLLLDDLPDVSKRIEIGLNWLKAKVLRIKKVIVAVQVVLSGISLYLFGALCFAMLQVPEWMTLANLILISSVFVTAVTSIIFVKNRVWHSIATDN